MVTTLNLNETENFRENDRNTLISITQTTFKTRFPQRYKFTLALALPGNASDIQHQDRLHNIFQSIKIEPPYGRYAHHASQKCSYICIFKQFLHRKIYFFCQTSLSTFPQTNRISKFSTPSSWHLRDWKSTGLNYL